MLDIVTLFRYTAGTVKNCESGRSLRRRGPTSFAGQGGQRGAKETIIAAQSRAGAGAGHWRPAADAQGVGEKLEQAQGGDVSLRPRRDVQRHEGVRGGRRRRDFGLSPQERECRNINLDAKVIEVLTATYGGTRIGRQELDGELIADVEGALWTRETIARARVPARAGEEYDRIVVGIDPPAGTGANADACGIVVAGSQGKNLYVLEDASVQGLSPEGWSNRVAAAALRWGSTTVVAEGNNGGAMVKSVIEPPARRSRCGCSMRRKARAPGPSRSPCSSRRARRSWSAIS